jgi:hypothetical protein
MGTDVYMEWDKQTEKEKKAQYTGFSINTGKFGYLRASIGMVKENSILRELFPPEFWEGGKARAFDFIKNWEKLDQLAAKYLSSCIFNIEMEIAEGQENQIAMGAIVCGMLTGEGFTETEKPHLENLRYCVMWINSLYEFCSLGCTKQEKKLNPKVYISW